MTNKKKPKPLLIVLIVVFVVIIGVLCTLKYLSGPVDKNNHEDIELVIENGSTSSQIGHLLKEKDLIRSEFLFKVYLKVYRVKSLKAATYLFQKDMDLKEIIDTLEEGSLYNPDMIKLTFKEGKRITDYAEVIAEGTNHTYEEVIGIFKDKEYAKTFIPDYWFLTNDIVLTNVYYPLEGYLAPDTYHFDNKDVEVKDIIVTMLKQMEKNLEVYKKKIEKDPRYYLTMASIVELEGTNSENREMIAGIFENRLSLGMSLGSDVTTYYGIQAPMTSDLTSEQFDSVNAYNTRSATMAGKMPIGPICAPGLGSIAASINPTKSDYYYFVADKHGKIYYTKTASEHSAKVAEIKAKGDWIW